MTYAFDSDFALQLSRKVPPLGIILFQGIDLVNGLLALVLVEILDHAGRQEDHDLMIDSEYLKFHICRFELEPDNY